MQYTDCKPAYTSRDTDSKYQRADFQQRRKLPPIATLNNAFNALSTSTILNVIDETFVISLCYSKQQVLHLLKMQHLLF
jgi:hypothetical protein